VLITSQAHGWDEFAVPVEVDVMARGESVAPLRRRAPGLGESDADLVAEAERDLPLALRRLRELDEDTFARRRRGQGDDPATPSCPCNLTADLPVLGGEIVRQRKQVRRGRRLQPGKALRNLQGPDTRSRSWWITSGLSQHAGRRSIPGRALAWEIRLELNPGSIRAHLTPGMAPRPVRGIRIILVS
jgi:hypothetical protein